MATLEQTAILFLTENTTTKPSIFKGFGYRVYDVLIDAQQSIVPENPGLSQYDVIVFHGMPTETHLQQVQKQHPATPTLVLLEQVTTVNHHQLLQLNVDDVLTTDLNQREVERRIQWAIKRHQKQYALLNQQEHLKMMTTLLHYMQTQDTIAEVLITLRDLYHLQAVALFPRDTSGLTRILTEDAMQIEEVPTYMQDFDPFMQVIEMGKSQYYADIMAHPYYTPLPSITEPRSVIILPIPNDDPTSGAIALFGQQNSALTEDDVTLFEIFARQFAAFKPQIVIPHVEPKDTHLLPVWQQMIELSTADHIIAHLHTLAERHHKVKQALVWVDALDDEPTTFGQTDTVDFFNKLSEMGYLQSIFDRLHESLEPILRWDSSAQDDMDKHLFTLMESECLVIFPIVDAARLIGIVIISTVQNRFLDNADMQSIENLVFAAGQAIERKTFTHLMHEEGTRLEAILQSIYEGTFFVDENDRVTFCNPQFTELTGISRSRVISQSSDTLIQQLAATSTDPKQTETEIREAIANLSASNDYYPIITINATDRDKFVIEIAAIDTTMTGVITWAGIIRPSNQAASQTTAHQLVDLIARSNPSTYTEVETIIHKMLDSPSRLTPKTTGHFVRKLDGHVNQIRLLWDNFIEVIRMGNGQARQDAEEIMLDTLLEYACDMPQFSQNMDGIRIQNSGQIPTVSVDMLQTTQAIASILMALYQPSNTLTVIIGEYEHKARLQIMAQQTATPFWPLEDATVVDVPTEQVMQYAAFTLGKELLEQNNGTLSTQFAANGAVTIDIMLPMTHSQTARTRVSPTQPSERLQQPGTAGSTLRGLKTIALLTGKSTLSDRMIDLISTAKHELIICNTTEELLQDLSTIRIDLIILDADLPGDDSVQTCQILRNRTTIPIMVLSDSVAHTHKLQSFELDIDDYIAQPITDHEITTRIDTIFSHLQTADRMNEPIKIGGLYINLARREVLLGGIPLELTRIEYDLLRYLAINVNQVLEHEELLAKVWGPEYRNEKHYLWVNISRLRKKLEPQRDSQRYIFNRPGIGYMLRTP